MFESLKGQIFYLDISALINIKFKEYDSKSKNINFLYSQKSIFGAKLALKVCRWTSWWIHLTRTEFCTSSPTSDLKLRSSWRISSMRLKTRTGPVIRWRRSEDPRGRTLFLIFWTSSQHGVSLDPGGSHSLRTLLWTSPNRPDFPESFPQTQTPERILLPHPAHPYPTTLPSILKIQPLV